MSKFLVAIIGAGASGLTAIKCCLDEGLEPVCFEQNDYLGGMWKFTEENSISSSVYQSTVINTSKEMMCYSDFPMPKHFPPFMHHSVVVKYFHLYAQHFGLEKYIRFGRKVSRIERADDFQYSGNWLITSKPTLENSSNEENMVDTVECFNAVMLCTGHHWQPSWPTLEGMETFEGLKIHSHSYKDFRGFEGKTVLVVGIGNSGGDIAVELSRHAKQVYLSSRRGAWVLSRLNEGGLPFDMMKNTRFFNSLPKSIINIAIESTCNNWFCHSTFGMRPSHSPLAQHPMINDALPHQIISGALMIKTDVRQFTKNGVEFVDGSTLNKLDAVIFCTGYDMRFPYLEIEQEIVSSNKVNLFKYVFPPFLKKTTLAVIGNVQPLGAINPLSELQARWACCVFAKKVLLPSEDEMTRDILLKQEMMRKRYYASKRHTVQVDFIEYSDELAVMVGCKPNLMKLFLTDPLLAIKCFIGPCTPPQYRLMGPGSWYGAKQAIENAYDNVIYATRTRAIEQSGLSILKVLVIIAIVTAIIFCLRC